MHRLSLTAPCSRNTLRPSVSVSKILVRARSVTIASRRNPTSFGPGRTQDYRGPNKATPAPARPGLQELLSSRARGKPISKEQLLPFLAKRVGGWARQPSVRSRLVSYGVPDQHLEPLLSIFSDAIQQGSIFKTLDYTDDHIERIAYDVSSHNQAEPLDIHFTRLLYEWTSHPSNCEHVCQVIPESIVAIISELFTAADMSNPSSFQPGTRAAPRRKVIMHVGPTNSGKTHNALRALAAAERGLYAGPLRLLAHEIFERLNKGQIVPLGVDPDDGGEADENTNMDLLTTEGGKAVVRKEGNPKYARVCNLITGEEQKILDEYAGLFSCTVEMVGTSARRFDVAVVDEIQLISDPERGGSWTTAVLGICTKELHLCGEERAVPLIQALLKDTGDELIVNRYERLTPLEVAEKSMDGDFSKVEKGDCLVTFSRMNIFRLKARIEKHSGLKCAVAYGRLPPELRSEQAALFNKPGTGYDVMIGSDAIGMGLNLKIKRIIFEYVRKWDGTSEKLLSVSQFKQIAGRAGRYGMHSKNKPGIVVTMQEADMPILRKALELPVEPLRYARINAAADDFIAVMQALPLGTSLSTAMQVFKYVAKMHPRYEYMDISDGVSAFDYIDSVVGELTLSDRLLLQHAPILWRDPVAVRAVVQVMKMYKTDMFVDYRKLLKDTDMQASLDEALVMMETGETQGASEEMMSGLESLHKTLVLYIWMSFRSSVAFPEREAVEEVKNQTEKVMDWCLQCMSTVKRRVPVWRDQWQTQVDKGNYSETAGGSYVSGSQRDTWKAQDEGPRISIPRNKLASQPQQRRSESWP